MVGFRDDIWGFMFEPRQSWRVPIKRVRALPGALMALSHGFAVAPFVDTLS
jgi:hypothetical protein